MSRRLVAAASLTGASASPSRAARMRIWAVASSPRRREVLARPGHRAAACNSSVDLPIPGSPPTRIAQPGTSPPPSTRSNSAMPGGFAHRQRAGLVERDEFDPPTAAREIVFLRENGRGRVLDKRVPFRAIGALPLPAVRNAATGLADIAAFGFGHSGPITGTLQERNCHRCAPAPLSPRCGKKNSG